MWMEAVGLLLDAVMSGRWGRVDRWPGQAQNAFQIEKWYFTHLARGNGGR